MPSTHPLIYIDALACQNAVNGVALLASLLAAQPKIIDDMQARGEIAGTRDRNTHPVMVVMLHKIADLAGVAAPLCAATSAAFVVCELRAQEVMRESRECPTCRGTGDDVRKDRSGEYLNCPSCDGKGWVL